MSALVSIITPVYNAERFLAETIESVLAQTYKNWEHLIVVDNNSRDRSEVIAREYASRDSRIKVIRDERAHGAARNRNVGLDAGKGELFAFIDADDLWERTKLEKQTQFMAETQSRFTFTSFSRLSEDGQVAGAIQHAPKEIRYDQMLGHNPVGCLTVMLSREVVAGLRFAEIGPEDLALWLKVLKRVDVGHGLNENLAKYRIVRGSRSNNKIYAAQMRWQTLRHVEELSLPKALLYFSTYAFHGLRKYARF